MCNKCKGGPETTSHSAISGHEVLSVLFPFFTKKYVNPQIKHIHWPLVE